MIASARRRFRNTRGSIALLAFGILSGCGAGEPEPPAGPPSPESILERYVEALGGREAFTSLESIRMTGVTYIPAMGLQGEFELLQGAPDRMLLKVAVQGLGDIVSGYDGEVGWSENPLVGASLTEGPELAQTAEEAHILATLRDTSLISELQTIEQTEFAGIPCWRVNFVWASGRAASDCYAIESGLLIATESVQATLMGDIPSTTLYFEYRTFDGRLFPTRVVQQAMGQEQEMRVRTVEFNTVDPAVFQLPAGVRTLLSGQ